MRKKMMLLALVVSAAMFAVPAVASAAEWIADNASGKNFIIDKSTNPVLRSSNGDVITCTGFTGSGRYTTDTTGEVSLDFTGCTENTFRHLVSLQIQRRNWGTIVVNKYSRM